MKKHFQNNLQQKFQFILYEYQQIILLIKKQKTATQNDKKKHLRSKRNYPSSTNQKSTSVKKKQHIIQCDEK